MERKIGEIFEHKGDKIEVIKSIHCNSCVFFEGGCEDNECLPHKRTDNTSVSFKKIGNTPHINDITDPEFPEPQISYEI